MHKLLIRRSRGWSLIELTIILIVLSILCAILAPVIGRFVRNARIIRCREDVQAIGNCMWMFMEDTALPCFLRDGSPNPAGGAGGSRPVLAASNRVEMLVGDGLIPVINPILATGGQWGIPLNLSSVDYFENHITRNMPGGNVANAYLTPLDLDKGVGGPLGSDWMFARRSSGGFNSEFAWRGPYMTGPIDPDPWGNRYASNVVYLDPIVGGDPNVVHVQGYSGWTYDCVVLSAGPDGEVDTEYSVDGLTPGDDDLIYTLSANSRP
mgnify:CR=1 FL=1